MAPTKRESCPLCALIETDAVVIDDGAAVAVEDASPLTPGHHLLLSHRHEPDFFALDPDDVAAIMSVAADVVRRLKTDRAPDGFNVGVNVGDAGDQTIGHVHLHVIPRYAGDTVDPRGGIRWIIADRARYWDLPDS